MVNRGRAEFVHLSLSFRVSFDFKAGTKGQRQPSLESFLPGLVKLVNGHLKDDIETSSDDLVRFICRFTIEAIPSTSCVVAAGIAMTIGVMIAAVGIVVAIALRLGPITIHTIKQAFFDVAGFVTESILEDFHTG